MAIPVWHDPELPCPGYPHYNQGCKADGVIGVGCKRCDVGWKWGPYNENIFDGLTLLKWLGKHKGSGSDVVIEPLLADGR
jgi:hypothetical protein